MAKALRTLDILLTVIVAGKKEQQLLVHLQCVHSLLFVGCTASSQDIVFNSLPVNQTVVEGGDATFSCSGTVDGTAQPTRYRIRSGVTVLQSVGGNISDLVTVSGIDAALLFGDFNSQLLLKGITREANGYTVTCAILVGAVFRDAMNTPSAHITVTSKQFSSLLNVGNLMHGLM